MQAVAYTVVEPNCYSLVLMVAFEAIRRPVVVQASMNVQGKAWPDNVLVRRMQGLKLLTPVGFVTEEMRRYLVM